MTELSLSEILEELVKNYGGKIQRLPSMTKAEALHSLQVKIDEARIEQRKNTCRDMRAWLGAKTNNWEPETIYRIVDIVENPDDSGVIPDDLTEKESSK